MSETVLNDWQARAESAEAALTELSSQHEALQAAAWDLLSALEGQTNWDNVAKAKRRLCDVFLDME